MLNRQRPTQSQRPATHRRVARLLTLTLLLLGLALALPAGALAAGSAGWSPQTSGTAESPWGVAFANASDGCAVGTDTIVHTANGGATWTVQSSGTVSYLGLSTEAIEKLGLCSTIASG